MPDPSPPQADVEDQVFWTPHGFKWAQIEVERTTDFRRRGRTWRVISLLVNGERRLEIYVSPTGRRLRVFRDGKELTNV